MKQMLTSFVNTYELSKFLESRTTSSVAATTLRLCNFDVISFTIRREHTTCKILNFLFIGLSKIVVYNAKRIEKDRTYSHLKQEHPLDHRLEEHCSHLSSRFQSSI